MLNPYSESLPKPLESNKFELIVAMADGHAEYWKWCDSRTIDLSHGLGVDRTQPGNPDLHKVQRAMWGKLGYEPQL